MSATVSDAAARSTASSAPRGPGAVCIAYGKTWADDIRKYHAAKATLPWQPEQQTPIKRVTRYEKVREEREYDLVLGKFRDAERELQQQRSEVDKRKQSLEHSRAKQLRNVQRFNLINHSPMYQGARDPKDPIEEKARPVRRTSNVDYNIVTNAPVRESDDEPPPKSPPLSPAAMMKNRRLRDFNILTNKYHDRHDQREKQEHEQAKQTAATKFFKKNDFHPVRIAFYDDDKEKAFIEKRTHDQRIHGKDRILKLPPREQFAEGKIYNIVNQNVINAAQLSRYEGQAQRATNKMQKEAFEKRMRAVGDRQAELDEALCLNRFAHKRHSQGFIHGFDPITNEPFDGINAKPRAVTRTHDVLPAWEVLERGVPSTTKVSGGSLTKTTNVVLASPKAAIHIDNQRANILVVDKDPAPLHTVNQVTERQAKTPVIRTGGFAQISQ